MRLKVKELAIVVQTGPDNYEVDIHQEDGKWVLFVTVVNKSTGEKTLRQIETARGNVKTWGKLEGAFAFVKEHCANCETLKVTVEGIEWALTSKTKRE